MEKFAVDIPPRKAAALIESYVLGSGLSVERVGVYDNTSPGGNEVVALVFEKYFMRNSSRASLTIIIENIGGETVVCSIGSGGGKGALFGFDWGAADNLESLAAKALLGRR